MKFNISFFLLSIGAVHLFHIGCRSDSNQPPPPDHHTSRLSLDWDGTYLGTLPCADCEGIHTEITLTAGYFYTIRSRYLGRSDSTFVTDGSFRWLDDGLRIELINGNNGSSLYHVGENRLFHLDSEGNRITGSLSDLYSLEKVEAEGH